MHITHLVSSFQFGGPERQILALGESWYPKADFSILSFSEKGKAKHFIREARNRDFPAHVLDNDTPFLFAAKRELVQRFKKLGTQVLYCHGYKANLVGRWAARSLKIPVVAVCRGWTGESLRVKLYERLDKCLLRRMDAVVCVSQAMGRRVHKHGVPLSRLRVIPNMTRESEMERDRTKARARLLGMFRLIPEYAFIYLAAGRLSPEKGFDLFVQAASMVRKENPQARFILFGEGKERDKLQRQIADLGLLDVFFLAGFRDTLDDILAGADCVVLSSHTEGMPNILLEAKAVGVPMVATRVGGVPEIVREGRNGLLVPAGSTSGLAAAMLEIIGSGIHDKSFEVAAADYESISCSPKKLYGGIAEDLLAGERLQDAQHNAWSGHNADWPSTVKDAPIPVVFVIDNLARAGTERQLLRLMQVFREQGELSIIERIERKEVRPILVLLDGTSPESLALEPDGVEIHRLGSRKLFSIRTIPASFRFVWLLWKVRPAAVQTYFIDSARFAVPLSLLACVSNIVHVRNNSGYWLPGKLPILDRFLAQLCRWHVTNNELSREVWIRKGVPRGRSKVIRNFLPKPVDNPGPILERLPGRLGIIANLRPVKRLPMLIRAIKRLKDEGHSVELRIAGEGPQRQELESLIVELDLAGEVILLGGIDDPMGFLQEIDIGVLCSESEGMPNVLFEYAAAGRAVVSALANWGDTAIVAEMAVVFCLEKDDFCQPDENGLFEALRDRLRNPAATRKAGMRVGERYRHGGYLHDAANWIEMYQPN